MLSVHIKYLHSPPGDWSNNRWQLAKGFNLSDTTNEQQHVLSRHLICLKYESPLLRK